MLTDVKQQFKGIFDQNLIAATPYDGDSIMESVAGSSTLSKAPPKNKTRFP